MLACSADVAVSAVFTPQTTMTLREWEAELNVQLLGAQEISYESVQYS